MSREVLCWCCEHYLYFLNKDNDNLTAFCGVKENCVSANNKVCKEFVKRKGLYTERKIPDYCKNHK